jgi:hypothetical protein
MKSPRLTGRCASSPEARSTDQCEGTRRARLRYESNQTPKQDTTIMTNCCIDGSGPNNERIRMNRSALPTPLRLPGTGSHLK